MPEGYEAEALEWRDRRTRRVAGPDGWLTVVGLSWLEPGENTVGSASGSAVELPAAAPPQTGWLDVQDGDVHFRACPGADVRHHGKPVLDIALRDDLSRSPTVLAVGSARFFVIRRADRLAVRVKDRASAARRAFAGLEYYPIEPDWRVEATFVPYAPPPTYHVPTILGTEEEYLGPGALAFEHGGRTLRLDAFLEPGVSDLFVVFGDQTNGTETYGAGRFLYAPQPDERGIVALDFNKAYNPPCVFTPHATCPIPLPQNRLPIRVEAGERRYRSEV